MRTIVTKDALVDEMTKSVNLAKLVEIVSNIADMVYSKNQDYGDAWQRYGIFTPLIRINDKLLRLQTLSDGRNALVAESVDDTLRDIIGYAVLALLWLDDNRDVDSTIRQIATMVMSENKE